MVIEVHITVLNNQAGVKLLGSGKIPENSLLKSLPYRAFGAPVANGGRPSSKQATQVCFSIRKILYAKSWYALDPLLHIA